MDSMSHNMQYLPCDQRLVDEIIYELKSKGIFDQFRKDCIADVDTRPAYQNLRQRVESSVLGFLSRQIWKPDLNKNQLREKLRKHILDANYLEQGVERIVDQVVNPKVTTVFIPQVEELICESFGITPQKSITSAETSNGKLHINTSNLLPTDLEAVSPDSVKSHTEDKEIIDLSGPDIFNNEDTKMIVVTEVTKNELIYSSSQQYLSSQALDKIELPQETQLSGISDLTIHDHESIDNSTIPLPAEEIKLEDIPAPDMSPPNVILENIELPKAPCMSDMSMNIPLPDEMPPKEVIDDQDEYHFKPIQSDDDDSSSDSSLRRNVSPITPIRNFNNENSCDAQQGFENSDSPDLKGNDKKKTLLPLSSFRFTIESKGSESSEDNSSKANVKKDLQQSTTSYNNQMIVATFSTPLLNSYDDSSNSNNLQIDCESDGNSKMTVETNIAETAQNTDSLLEMKSAEKKSSHKSSHRSRDSHRNSNSKERRSHSKHSSSRDRKDFKSDRKSSKDDNSKSKSSHRESSKEGIDKKDSKDASKTKHSSSHRSSNVSKTHKSSSSSTHHSSSTNKQTDEKKGHKLKNERQLDSKSSKDQKLSKHSSSHYSDKERKCSSSRSKDKDEKDKDKKNKKPDDHYNLSGRGNNGRRSTDRDSNDGNSSSSKSGQIPSSSKSVDSKKENNRSSKSDNTSTSSETTSPSDSHSHKITGIANNNYKIPQTKPVVIIDAQLETPVCESTYLPIKPDICIKKPKFAANFEEARQLMKMRKYLEAEERRKTQDATLLLEFQQNVRPSLSQIYSNIPGPEFELVCSISNSQPLHSENNIVQDVEYIMENVNNEAIEENNYNNLSDQHIQANPQNIDDTDLKVCDIDVTEEILTPSPAMEKNNKKLEFISESPSNSSLQAINIKKVLLTSEHNFHKLPNMSNIINNVYQNMNNIEMASPSTDTNHTEQQVEHTAKTKNNTENELLYFDDEDRYHTELKRDKFITFYENFIKESPYRNKLYLINSNLYVENLIKEMYENIEIVSYCWNGHLKRRPQCEYYINDNKNVLIFQDETLSSEDDSQAITPTESLPQSPIFSPIKSDCSFESSDNEANIEEMTNSKSRQEIMEIILGGFIPDESHSKSLKIDNSNMLRICNDDEFSDTNIKRKLNEIDNNNENILSPKKIRKTSETDQISSTTEGLDIRSNQKVPTTQSKYLGKVRRVGLPKPKKVALPNSPCSDKSVENYEQNKQEPTQANINGKVKINLRNKMQRYDTSDLYKPKLHYLSRRNVN